MNGLFKESTMGTITKFKKGFLWTAVCLLIGGFALGTIMILASTWSVDLSRFLATMLILIVVLFVGVNNFIRMEKGTKLVQVLALMGLIAGILAAILGILAIWGLIPVVEYSYSSYSSYAYSYYMMESPYYMMSSVTIWAKILSVLSSVAAAGFWISNVMSIKETNKVVKPLKITSMIYEIYCAIYAIILIFSDYQIMSMNLNILSAFAGVAFFVTAVVAWVISRTVKEEPKVEAVEPMATEPMITE